MVIHWEHYGVNLTGRYLTIEDHGYLQITTIVGIHLFFEPTGLLTRCARWLNTNFIRLCKDESEFRRAVNPQTQSGLAW